mgnify:CR=1 FL=1
MQCVNGKTQTIPGCETCTGSGPITGEPCKTCEGGIKKDIPDCTLCTSADQCFTSDPCLNAGCFNGTCTYLPRSCDDGLSCTADACTNTGCTNTPIAGCVEPTTPPEEPPPTEPPPPTDGGGDTGGGDTGGGSGTETVTIRITNVHTPCEDLAAPYTCVDSFVANRARDGDRITITAVATQGTTDISSQISWTCADLLGDAINSGACAPATGTGATYTFIPNPPDELTGRTAPLAYQVVAQVTINRIAYEGVMIIRQDPIDEIRQEYEDMPGRVSQLRVNFDRDTAAYTGLIGTAAEPGRHNNWHILRLNNLNQHAIDLDNNYAGNLTVTSGYRCPRGNRAAGGEATSRHQYGRALDFDQQSSEENYNVWSAASTASLRLLYDQNNQIVNNSLIIQYHWTLMTPGVTSYTHGHVDWQ